MKSDETIFVIPTNRLRDVAETVEKYDQHFWTNGHAVKIMVFDDSSVANFEKYYSLLEQTKTVNDLFYVGPREKERFLKFLNDESGQDLIEYTLLMAFIGLVAVALLAKGGTSVNTIWKAGSSQLSNAVLASS